MMALGGTPFCLAQVPLSPLLSFSLSERISTNPMLCLTLMSSLSLSNFKVSSL